MNSKIFPVFFAGALALPAFAKGLEEVYVEGELQSQDLLKLSNSVSVINNELLEQREAHHLEDVLNIAPNVNFSTGASRGRFFQIRGVGERSEFTAPVNASVGVLLDGINFTGVGLGVSTLDTAQVEIFRGPQGTLFGANALAGLINIVGSDAQQEASLDVKLGYGNYNSGHASAILNSPVSDSLGWRLAVGHHRSDGFIENDFLDREDTQNIDETSVRNVIQFDGGKNQVKFITYYVDVDNGYDAFSLDNNRVTLSDEPGKDQQETFANALHYGSTIGEHNFKAILAHVNSDVNYGYDEDWSYREICAIDSECAFYQYSTSDYYARENDNTSLDLRLSSGGDNWLQWVVGFYVNKQNVDLTRTYTNNDPSGDSFYEPVGVPEVSLYSSDFSVTQSAIYGQFDTAFTDKLKLITGLRYEDYRADFSDSNAENFSPDDGFWGGKIALEYDLEQHFLYALVSRGYKAGGFNPDPDVSSVDKTFDSETMWNFELGDKYLSAGGSLSLQLAAFYQQRKDVQAKQSRAFAEGGTIQFVDFMDNAAEGKNYGLESSFAWLASSYFEFDGSLALLQTEYIDFNNLSHVDRDADTGEGYDMSGREQAHAPSYQYYLAADVLLSEALTLRLAVEGKDEFYFSESHNEKSKAYDLLNVRVKYEVDNWQIALWGKNITDELVETRGFYFSNDFGNDPRKFYAPEPYSQKGAPRTVGVTAAVQF